VNTIGGDPDTDGYEIVVGAEKRKVEAAGGATFQGLQPGDYTIALEGVASNCIVTPDPAQTVTLAGPGVVAVRFVVLCASTGIQIAARTSGFGRTGGFLISIDGGDPVPTDSLGALVVSRLEPGLHEVVIDPGNDCTLSGPARLTVEVVNRALTTLSIDITCGPPSEVTIRFGNLFDCGDPDQDPTIFQDDAGSSRVTVPVGAKVIWYYETYMHPACGAQIISTLVPPGGLPIDSGILRPGESFEFIPAVPGTWRFTDRFSGGSGELIVVAP
jgi:hypothetical protein